MPRRIRRSGPELVAHRGYALRYPENTIEGLTAAIEAGARFLEFDVQLAADGVPVLLHDANLQRTAGIDARVMELPLERLSALEVNESARLGDGFSGVRIPTLADAASLLGEQPQVTAFVEIKRESLDHFGPEFVVERVLADLEPAAARCVPISFDQRAAGFARERGATAIGWVLSEWSRAACSAAETLAPEYLFCNYKLIPPAQPLWPGPWRWALYDVSDPVLAVRLGARGAHLVETMAIKEMLGHPLFAQSRGNGR